MGGPDREPGAPSFERIRRLAGRLLRECRAGDPGALARVRAQLPGLAAPGPASAASQVRLADVQHALAREAGLESWAALKRHAQAQEPLVAQLERFLLALRHGDAATMRQALQGAPAIARASVHAACAACDAALVEAWLAREPANAVARLGGSGWTPLNCLAASPLFALDASHAAASATIGARLLSLGADPNGFTPAGEPDPARRQPVLYRASEHGNAGLVRVLLEHGADPNDGESIYHAAERNHRDVLALLLEHGADLSAAHPTWTNTPLYFLAWYREGHPRTQAATEGMRWLLEHGADPNVPSYERRETPLHRIAELGRGAGVAELLLGHGADPARPRADGRTPYELAVRAGNRAVAGLLRARGAAPAALRPIDAFLGACAAGDVDAARRVRDAHPGLLERLESPDRRALVAAAQGGQAAAVRALATLGFDVAWEGEEPGTALHHAAWRGEVGTTRALLELGAPVDARDREYGSSPLAWAAHGSGNCREADEAYAGVIDLLIAAGASRQPSFNRWGEPPEALASDAVAGHLRATGFAPPD
jgi:ankyrin repeat protein